MGVVVFICNISVFNVRFKVGIGEFLEVYFLVVYGIVNNGNNNDKNKNLF